MRALKYYGRIFLCQHFFQTSSTRSVILISGIFILRNSAALLKYGTAKFWYIKLTFYFSCGVLGFGKFNEIVTNRIFGKPTARRRKIQPLPSDGKVECRLSPSCAIDRQHLLAHCCTSTAARISGFFHITRYKLSCGLFIH